MALKPLTVRTWQAVLAAAPLVLGATADPALCGTTQPSGQVAAAASLERHFTTNALDNDRPVSDWYTLLRGSLKREWGDADVNASLGAEFQATHYDTVSIEDDRTLALSAEAFRRFDGFELRGTLTYAITSTGDDLEIGPLDLGTRALKQTAGGQVQLGVDLGHATALILEAADSFERTGPTSFQDGLLEPVRLDPDTNRLRFGARLTHTVGAVAFGASASALLMSVEKLGTPPIALSLERYGLRGELAVSGGDGATFGLALGAELLRGAHDIYCRARPAWQMTFTKPLPHDLNLRGTWFGRYETDDTDDPLASWLQRAELSVGGKIDEALNVSSGLAWQIKQNLLFENEERSHGLFAQADYGLSPSTALVLRVDILRTFKTVLDTRDDTVDAFIGVRAKL